MVSKRVVFDTSRMAQQLEIKNLSNYLRRECGFCGSYILIVWQFKVKSQWSILQLTTDR